MIGFFHGPERHSVLAVLLILSATAFPRSELAAQRPVDFGPPWPPYLSESYPEWQPGDELTRPIQPHVMRQTAEAVLALMDGAITHVDELIVQSRLVQNQHMLAEYVLPYALENYEYLPGLPRLGDVAEEDLFRGAGKGIGALSAVRAEM